MQHLTATIVTLLSKLVESAVSRLSCLTSEIGTAVLFSLQLYLVNNSSHVSSWVPAHKDTFQAEFLNENYVFGAVRQLRING